MRDFNGRVIKLERHAGPPSVPVVFAFDTSCLNSVELAVFKEIGSRLFYLTSDDDAARYIDRLTDDDLGLMITACHKYLEAAGS